MRTARRWSDRRFFARADHADAFAKSDVCAASDDPRGGVDEGGAAALPLRRRRAESICRGETAVGFASCILHDGDVACPEGPFAKRSLAGDRASVACSGCTTCDTTLACTSPTIRYYNDSACKTETASRVVDGMCNPVASGATGNPFTHLRYDAKVESTCTTSPPASSVVTFDRPRTLCCR